MNGSTAKAIAGVLLTTGAMTSGVGVAAGMADAQPAFGTFVAPHPAGGPWTWCPGDSLTSGLNPATGRGAPGVSVNWDMRQCHTWYYVNWGYGNVTPSVWDGPNPPEEGTAIRQCPPISFMCP